MRTIEFDPKAFTEYQTGLQPIEKLLFVSAILLKISFARHLRDGQTRTTETPIQRLLEQTN